MKDKHLVWLLVAACAIAAFWLLSKRSGGSEELSPEDRIFARQRALIELNQAIKEIDRRLQHAIALNDQRAIERYSPMAYRLVAIRQRMQEARGFLKQSDPEIDLAEIREIRAKLGR